MIASYKKKKNKKSRMQRLGGAAGESAARSSPMSET